jgi:hypothetical protein
MKWFVYVIMCKGYEIINEATGTEYACVFKQTSEEVQHTLGRPH